MNRKELQKRIDKTEKSAVDMREIGGAYLKGDVIKDDVAAEAWLMKAVEMEDDLESPLAMALVAREILGQEQVLQDEDYLQIRREYEELRRLEADIVKSCQETREKQTEYQAEKVREKQAEYQAEKVREKQAEHQTEKSEKRQAFETLLQLATERQKKL